MRQKLAALLVAGTTLVIGGVAYRLALPKPGVTRAELRDAGIDEQCDAVEVSCQGRDLCQNALPDGGLSKRYRTLRTLAWQCDRDGGDPILIAPAFRQNGRQCFEPVGDPDDTCRVLGPSFDDGGILGATDDLERCVCRARGQVCRMANPDGGAGIPIDFNRTYDQGFGPFVGAGCTRKSCEEMAGEQGLSMPDECR